MASLITNIKLKYDTLANWTREDMEGKGAFLVLQRGEVGFCEVPSNIEGALPTILFKVGDGNSTFGELNWVSALASDVRPWAKAENKPEYSAAEINGLSEYITQAVKDTNTEYRFNKVNDYEYEFQSKEIGGTEWNVDFTLTIPKYDGTPAFKPTGKSYLTFSSPSSFTLAVGDATKHWNGTLEYFSSDKVWTTWDGTTTLSSVDNDGEHVLYIRGTGNTKLSYYDEVDTEEYIPWEINGTGVRCDGNIETLLDYATVEAGQHPTMAEECFAGLFMYCTALITPPALPATTLANYCYSRMFLDCTSLTKAPALPATTLASHCYYYMFNGCTGLIQAPTLPATTLAEYCYYGMFSGCSGLTQVPALSATTLKTYCYSYMFDGCTGLTQAPALSATTLAEYCYQGMFYGCTSLTQAPALPATTLANYCYSYMFQSCKSLTQAPALPATTLESSCYIQMFYGCTSLKLSSTQTDEYTQEYRIPSSGTGTTATNALSNMFISTGGTFTGTPEINTTYYLSTDNMIVRETEIATLNGYVGSIAAPISHVSDATVHVTAEEKAAWNAKTGVSFKPEGKSYLTFSSPSSFTLKVSDATNHWNGTLEYFSSDKVWTTWDGTTLSSVDNDGEHVLYLRGTGNTVITGNSSNYKWVLTGSDVVCSGNIENLLDYVTVESGAHPTMANFCYAYMFQDCTSLTQAPTLPVTTLAEFCYFCMFDGCSGLTQAPALPATTMARYCYGNMFSGCTSLTQAPALSATTLAEYCYQGMFLDCTSLTQAPALPATTLANYCYSYMFQSCKSLTQAPALPATTLAEYCYQKMFLDCTSLNQAPALPATTLANYCYSYMFQSCKSLTQAPALPATTLAEYCYREMFYGCTSLNQAPALPATTLAKNCYYEMFRSCTSLTQAPALPATTLANYCYREMFYGCTSLKLSSTQTGEYMQEYRIPSSGTGITVSYALTDMFASTGGTFTGTPEINTTYYLSTDNMIVRETEIATLNGYVGSMINQALAALPDGDEVSY